MKIGVLELLCDNVNRSAFSFPLDFFVVKQYASIMPQAVSVWCRQLGHDVYYSTYYGFNKPENCLPRDLDVIFISCFSRGSHLAYALARLFKIQTPGVTLILGGPHAKQFAGDAIRFFDVVVQSCDKVLIKELLTDLPRKAVVNSNRELTQLPTIEERLPEIKKAFFWRGRPSPFSFIPILSSIGCPFACDFCVDWNTQFHLFDLAQLEHDLKFAAKNFPQVRINFYDPNFGVKFEQVMAVIERIKHPKKRWFLTEGSLDSLTDERLTRLEKAGCLCVIPGIETWSAYSKKTGVGPSQTPLEKLDKIVRRFNAIHRHIPITQANLIFGLDTDKGDDPILLTKAFIRQTPWVSHSLNIPAPFGETPMFHRLSKKDRILKHLPYTFYCKPYLAIVPKHYSPIELYDKLIDVFSFMTSVSIGVNGITRSKSWIHKGYQPIRAASLKRMLKTLKQIRIRLKKDRAFREFHEGNNPQLPEFYHQKYESLLGPYRQLVSRKERIPKIVPDIEQRKCA